MTEVQEAKPEEPKKRKRRNAELDFVTSSHKLVEDFAHWIGQEFTDDGKEELATMGRQYMIDILREVERTSEAGDKITLDVLVQAKKVVNPDNYAVWDSFWIDTSGSADVTATISMGRNGKKARYRFETLHDAFSGGMSLVKQAMTADIIKSLREKDYKLKVVKHDFECEDTQEISIDVMYDLVQSTVSENIGDDLAFNSDVARAMGKEDSY